MFIARGNQRRIREISTRILTGANVYTLIHDELGNSFIKLCASPRTPAAMLDAIEPGDDRPAYTLCTHGMRSYSHTVGMSSVSDGLELLY